MLLTKEQLKQDYAELKSVRKLAAKHNVHHKTMSQWLKNFNIKFEPKLTRTKKNNIFSEETEDSFYLAGFIAADGNILHRQNNYHLSIGLGLEDESHLLLIRSLLGSNATVRIDDSSSVINGKSFTSTIKRFTVCSKQIYNDLINNFCVTENKSLTLKFPKHLENHKLLHHFIRGYFDGDGSFSVRNPTIINKQSKINICFDLLGTQDFLLNTKNILNKNLELPPNNIGKHNSVYRLRYSGNRLSSVIGNWLYKDATIYLQRKYDKYLMAKRILSII